MTTGNRKGDKSNICIDCGKSSNPVRPYMYRERIGKYRCQNCYLKWLHNNEESRKKSSKGWFKKGQSMNRNEKNPMWKGTDVGYIALHNWVRQHKPEPKLCECCHKTKPHDVANISGKYERNVDDFEWLCRKCHMIKDGRLVKFNKHCRFLAEGKMEDI